MHIICFGDSITYGYGLPTHKNWINLVTAKALQNGIELNMYNAGVNGETALDGFRRLPKLLEAKTPDTLYVQFGLNDAWQGQTVEGYVHNMQKIVSYAQDKGCGRICVASNHIVHVAPEEEEYGGREYCDQVRFFNAALRRAFNLQDAGVTFIDIEAACAKLAFKEQASLLQPDGVHISAKGYYFYCDILYPYFLDLNLHIKNGGII